MLWPSGKLHPLVIKDRNYLPGGEWKKRQAMRRLTDAGVQLVCHLGIKYNAQELVVQVGYGKDGGFDGGGRSRPILCLDAHWGAHLYSCEGGVFC